MNSMNRQYLIVLTAFLTLLPNDITAGPLERLAERLLPENYRQFLFIQEPSPKQRNYFEISESKGRIRIRGNSPVSMSYGLNWYLKYIGKPVAIGCGNQLLLPEELPVPQNLIRKETPLPHGFYLNYPTFGQTAFWGWPEWEAEIDRMALNGVTIPLALVGMEQVWINTLKHFGYTEKEARSFLPGPPYTTWLLTGQATSIGGPMPPEWTNRQKRLQRRIVRYMRTYGMTPVFQAFTGIVPPDLKEKYPEAHFIDPGSLEGEQQPAQLDPTDPLFTEMAEVWYKEYEKLYGKTIYYCSDFTGTEKYQKAANLPEAVKNIQKALTANDSRNVWLILTGSESFQPDILTKLEKASVLIIDSQAECRAEWDQTGSFGGFPWIWAHTTNWRWSSTALNGHLDAIATEPIRARQEAASSSYIKGIGAVPEWIGANPAAFDLAWEMRWRDESPDIPTWLQHYTVYRYGIQDERLKTAWNLFYQTVYAPEHGHCSPSESCICVRPGMDLDEFNLLYDIRKFKEGVRLLASARDLLRGNNTYEHDLTDFTRQLMSDKAKFLYTRIKDSFNRGDQDSLKLRTDRFLELLLLQDRLLSCRSEFCLSTWISQARDCVEDPAAKDQMEKNARMFLTIWDNQDSDLADTGQKEWSGLIRDYYYPRWQLFFNWLNRRAAGQHVVPPRFTTLEKEWTESHEQSQIPKADLYETVDSCLSFTLL